MLKSKIYIVPSLLAIWTLVSNVRLFQYLIETSTFIDFQSGLFVAFLFFFTLSILFIVYLLLTWSPVDRFLIPLLLVINAFANYFLLEYKILIDGAMIENILTSDSREAGEYFNLRAMAVIFFTGVLPVLFYQVIRKRCSPVYWHIQILRRLQISLVIVGFILAGGLTFYKPLSFYLRSHKEVKALLTPINYAAGLVSYLKEQAKTHSALVHIEEGSQLNPEFWKNSAQKTILVLVVGETARSQNFQISGYSRETTPRLLKEKVLHLKDVQACGTSTAVSVPCIFSPGGRAKIDIEKPGAYTNLLDILALLNFDVFWIDNNTGCKGLCPRTKTIEFHKEPYATQYCSSGKCYDQVLVDAMEQAISSSVSGKIVIVLHQLGSHGPAYYLRVPPEFEKFSPVCRQSDLGSCSREEVINSYDNTIYYTDFVLSEVIQKLKSHKEAQTAMIYVSDHGESLGEKGLYLHAVPYWMAPAEQIKVPMIMWFSPEFESRFALSSKCLQQKSFQQISHDHFFHSIIGLLRIQNSYYNKKLNIFRDCSEM